MAGDKRGDGSGFVGADVDKEIVVRGEEVHCGADGGRVVPEGEQGGRGEDMSQEDEFAAVVELARGRVS